MQPARRRPALLYLGPHKAALQEPGRRQRLEAAGEDEDDDAPPSWDAMDAGE